MTSLSSPSWRARHALRSHLARRRPGLTPPLRTALHLGVVCAASLVALLAVLYGIEPQTARALSTFLAFHFLSGREPAMLWALHPPDAVSVWWVAPVAILNDFTFLFLCTPLVWIAVQRLRHAPLVGEALVSLEKSALENQAAIRRFGLPGLAGFVLFPALGTGSTAGAALGLVAQLPHTAVLVWMAGTTVVVNVLWAYVLGHVAVRIPAQGPWTFLPLIIVGVVFVAIIARAMGRRRGLEEIRLAKVPDLDAQHLARLEQAGIVEGRRSLRVDCETLRQHMGVPNARPSRCRAAAELLLLPSMRPADTRLLTHVGIQGVGDLAVAEPRYVRRAVEEASEEEGGHAEEWTDRAWTWREEARRLTEAAANGGPPARAAAPPAAALPAD